MDFVTLLDAVGAPDWVVHEFLMSLMVAPFVIAGGIIFFSRFLEWYSKRKDDKPKYAHGGFGE